MKQHPEAHGHEPLIDVLRGGSQCDEDGVMCIVSRQACHEAADLLERLLTTQQEQSDGS